MRHHEQGARRCGIGCSTVWNGGLDCVEQGARLCGVNLTIQAAGVREMAGIIFRVASPEGTRPARSKVGFATRSAESQ